RACDSAARGGDVGRASAPPRHHLGTTSAPPRHHLLPASLGTAEPYSHLPGLRGGAFPDLAGGVAPGGQGVSGVLPPNSYWGNAGLSPLLGCEPLSLLHLSTVWQRRGPGWQGSQPVEDWAHCRSTPLSAARHPQDRHHQQRGGWLVCVLLQ